MALAKSGSIWDSSKPRKVSICSVSVMAMIASTSVKPHGTGTASSSGAIGSRPSVQGWSARGSTSRRVGLILTSSEVGIRDIPGQNSLSCEWNSDGAIEPWMSSAF